MDARRGRATSGAPRLENGQGFDRSEIKTDRVSNFQTPEHLEQTPAGREMSEPKKGLASLGLDNAIRLRWALRDIRGKRLKLSPVDPIDLSVLIDMGYVEMINDEPVATGAGLQEIGD
jgi:hypothetical protein